MVLTILHKQGTYNAEHMVQIVEFSWRRDRFLACTAYSSKASLFEYDRAVYTH